MEERNREYMNEILPQEIPIPDMTGKKERSSVQSEQPASEQRPYGQQGQPASEQQPYGQQGEPASEQRLYGQQGEPVSEQQSYGQQGQPIYGQQAQSVVRPYQPHDRKTGKIIGIVACVLAAVIIMGILAAAFYTSRPMYKIAKGLHNLSAELSEIHNPLADKLGLEDIITMLEEDGGHVATRLNFTAEALFGSMTLGVDTQLYKDVQAKELDSSTTVSIMNYEIAHLNLYGNEDVICFGIPELFLENMYFDTENVVSQYNASVWADENMFGRLDMEDFSVELFPEDQGRISIGNHRTIIGFMEKYGSDLEACRENMTVYKVESGVYGAEFTQQDMDRLFKDMLHYYNDLYGMDEIDLEEGMEDYEQFIASDVNLLFVIDHKNRIESITLEKPVEMLDGEASVDWELFFMGEKRSVDKMQGKVTVTNASGEETEMIGQLVQTLEDDDYQINMDIKYSEEEGQGKMRLAMDCDASDDTFDMSLSMKTDDGAVELAAEGTLDDIVQGESFALDLDALTIDMDGEEICKLTGDIAVAPLQESITPGVEAETAIFEMSYAEIGDLFYKIVMEYGNLMDLLEY